MKLEDKILGELRTYINSLNIGDVITVNDFNKNIEDFNNSAYDYGIVTDYLAKSGFLSYEYNGLKINYYIPDVLKTQSIINLLIEKGIRLNGLYSTNSNDEVFDIEDYFAHEDFEASKKLKEENMQEQKNKIIYEVDMKTGKISHRAFMAHDISWKTSFNMFDDEDAAEAFAEGLVTDDTEHDAALDKALDDIATTLIRESSEDTDPAIIFEGDEDDKDEYPWKEDELYEIQDEITRVEFDGSKAQEESEIPLPADLYIPVHIKPGTEVFVISKEHGHWFGNVNVNTSTISKVILEVNKDNVTTTYFTSNGDRFTKDEIDKTAFTCKNKMLTALASYM